MTATIDTAAPTGTALIDVRSMSSGYDEAPVVRNLDRESIAVPPHRHARLRGPGVRGRVGQRFADDVVRRQHPGCEGKNPRRRPPWIHGPSLGANGPPFASVTLHRSSNGVSRARGYRACRRAMTWGRRPRLGRPRRCCIEAPGLPVERPSGPAPRTANRMPDTQIVRRSSRCRQTRGRGSGCRKLDLFQANWPMLLWRSYGAPDQAGQPSRDR